MIKMQIEEGMDKSWRHMIGYQVDYLLAPISKNIKSGEINFYTSKESKILYYSCEMIGKDKFGMEFRFRAKNSNGETAINDAVSRVRREFLRKDKGMIE